MMKRRGMQTALLVVLAACLLTACRPRSGTPRPVESESGFYLYFLNSETNVGSAIAGEPYVGQTPTAQRLINALLAGPTREGLSSPFPNQTALNGWSLTDGLLTVDLSEHYGDLAGIDLTLADYCLTLTLCQLDRVEQVRITVAGRGLAYRDHDILDPSEAVLEDLVPADWAGNSPEETAGAS